MNVSVILAGGTGVRFMSEVPKQYASLLGKEVISYVITAARGSVKSYAVFVVAQEAWRQSISEKYTIECVLGGETHNLSVNNALLHIKETYPACSKVVFVDAARPFVTANFIDKHFDALDSFDAAVTAQKLTDSLGHRGETFANRDDYYLIQKPESFRYDVISRFFCATSSATAIVQQLPIHTKIIELYDLPENLKITYPDDLSAAEYLLTRHIKEVK
jgi:2-C-methyl-D-erythritol 4-phosphate cytidylyltransferase